MSKLEEKVKKDLSKHFYNIVEQPEMPVTPPWFKSKIKAKADFLLNGELYIEVKGIMTLESMEKMLWFTQQNFPYYILQATEKDDWILSYENQILELSNLFNLLIENEIDFDTIRALKSKYLANEFSYSRVHYFITNRLNKMNKRLGSVLKNYDFGMGPGSIGFYDLYSFKGVHNHFLCEQANYNEEYNLLLNSFDKMSSDRDKIYNFK